MNRLKVKLIDTGSPRKEINEPVGIGTLAAEARAHIKNTKIQLYSMQLDTEVSMEGQDLIGISTKLDTLDTIDSLVSQYRELSSSSSDANPKLVLGDLHPTFALEETLKRFPEAICVIGEGEKSFVEILRTMQETTDSLRKALIERDIPNLGLIVDGEIVKTKRQVFDISNAEVIARDLTPQVIDANGITRLESSRGCSWGRCKFCSISGKYGVRGWRPYRIEKVVNELENLSELGARRPYFNDEDFFGGGLKRGRELAQEIIKAKQQGRIHKDFKYFVSLRSDTIVGKNVDEQEVRNTLRLLQESGLDEVFIGIESASPSQLKRYAKIGKTPDNLKALELLREFGFVIDVGFIMFDRETTKEDLKHNIKFIDIAGLREHHARLIKNLRIQPGAKLGDRAKEQAMILDLNSLCYPYEFKYQDVAEIYEKYLEYEKTTKDFEALLQAQYRGEGNEGIRENQRSFLGTLRSWDLHYLEKLIDGKEDELDEALAAKCSIVGRSNW